MAKTIDREKNSAARTSDAVREPLGVEETEPVDDAEFDDTVDADAVDDAAEVDANEELAVAPVDEERVVARRTAGVQAPDALLKNPLTRGLTEAYIELRKVTWPTRRDAWNMTLVTIIVSALMAGLLAAADYGLGHLLSYLVSLGLGH